VAELTGLAPVLLVADVPATLDHYRDVLGFEVESYELVPGHYGYARRGACYLHFACFDGVPPRPNSEVVDPTIFDVYLYVDDIDALYEELVARGADILHPPTERAWRMREIRVRDLNGYVLGIGQPLD
jgi:uncharacterized glyoxalase superfamily protein PhnB